MVPPIKAPNCFVVRYTAQLQVWREASLDLKISYILYKRIMRIVNRFALVARYDWGCREYYM